MKNNKVNVNNNVSAFLKLCPFKDLNEVVKKFTCKNGSAILKYDLSIKSFLSILVVIDFPLVL